MHRLAPLLSRHLDQGWCVLPQAIEPVRLARLIGLTDRLVDSADDGVRRSAGAVYAARNVIEVVPEILDAWRSPTLVSFVKQRLGVETGLVRVLYFDKPPEQTWALPWHKDLLIAVQPFQEATGYSPPRLRAGVPHSEPPLEVLESMLTLRLHLDEITVENGPLQIAAGSHRTGKALQMEGFERHTICTAAGDVLAMTPLLAHSSGRSNPLTSRHRRVLHLEFSHLRHLPESVHWHCFDAV